MCYHQQSSHYPPRGHGFTPSHFCTKQLLLDCSSLYGVSWAKVLLLSLQSGLKSSCNGQTRRWFNIYSSTRLSFRGRVQFLQRSAGLAYLGWHVSAATWLQANAWTESLFDILTPPLLSTYFCSPLLWSSYAEGRTRANRESLWGTDSILWPENYFFSAVCLEF